MSPTSMLGKFGIPPIAFVLFIIAFLFYLYEQYEDPIVCFTPADLNHTNVKIFCEKNSYYVPPENSFSSHDGFENNLQTYYDKVSYIMFFQAVLFCIPHFAWLCLRNTLEIKYDNIYKKAVKFKQKDVTHRWDDREAFVAEIANDFKLQFSKRTTKTRRGFGSEFFKRYMVTRVLLLVVTLLQFPYMSYWFEQKENTYFGFALLYYFMEIRRAESDIFPVRTWCNVKPIDNNQDPILQCALPRNETYKIVYVLFCIALYTFLFAVIMDVISDIICRMCSKNRKRRCVYTIVEYLKKKQKKNNGDVSITTEDNVKEFVYKFLGVDAPLRSFAQGYCSANLNFLLIEGDISVIFQVDKSDGEPLDYYFYIPLILVLQAVALWLPHLIWKWSQSDLDYRLDYIYKKAMNKAFRIPVKERVEESVDKVNKTVKKYRIITKTTPFRGLRFFQLHIMSKLLSILVLILQLAGMSYYFGRGDSPYWGFSLIYNIAFVPSLESGIFPVYTYCNLTRIVDKDEPVKFVLCDLWLNKFNEALFFWIWIWFAMLIIFNIAYVLYFVIGLWKGSFWFENTRNLQEMLIYRVFYTKNPKFNASKDEIESVEKFITDFLDVDGVYLMQLIRVDGGELVTSQICERLYDLYMESLSVNDEPDTRSEVKNV